MSYNIIICCTLMFPASLMASTSLSWRRIWWLRMWTPDIAQMTTSTNFTASTRLWWSLKEPNTRRAPCSLNDNSIWTFSMSTPISGLWRTYVSWAWARLAFTNLLPRYPVPPMMSTLLFSISLSLSLSLSFSLFSGGVERHLPHGFI